MLQAAHRNMKNLESLEICHKSWRGKNTHTQPYNLIYVAMNICSAYFRALLRKYTHPTAPEKMNIRIVYLKPVKLYLNIISLVPWCIFHITFACAFVVKKLLHFLSLQSHDDEIWEESKPKLFQAFWEGINFLLLRYKGRVLFQYQRVPIIIKS